MSSTHFDECVDVTCCMFYQISQRILEAHANVQEMTLLEAKMNYIRAWQTLPEYGLTYFIIKLQGSKKEVRIVICTAFCIVFIMNFMQ